MRVLLIAGAGNAQCGAEGNLYAAPQLADGQYFKRNGLVVDMLGNAVTRFQFIDFHDVFFCSTQAANDMPPAAAKPG